MNFKRITNCRACGSSDLFPYLDLASSPPANRLVDEGAAGLERIEMMVVLCKKCFLSQLSVVVDPQYLYSSYVYHSSVSKTFREHCGELARHLKTFQFKNAVPASLDIASNDGCMLRAFREAGFRVSGFEPCGEMAAQCCADGLMTTHDFFTYGSAARLTPGFADVVTATNVLAHIDDLDDFLSGVKLILNEDGVFVAEFPHLLSMVDFNQFDTIYHEHLSYFLLKPLLELFRKNGLEIFRAEEIEIHGGSLRIYAGHEGKRPVELSVGECILNEDAGAMYDMNTYKEFSNWVVRLGSDLRTVLHHAKVTGKKVIGYGAAAKGISLTNYLGLGKYIHSIVDDTPQKQGKLTPGERIPIVSFEAFEREKPDFILLFAWNFLTELKAKTAHLGARYIVPIPTPVIE